MLMQSASAIRLCNFELNNKPMSSLQLSAIEFPAFSGMGSHINQRLSTCVRSQGPIPQGEYLVLDRQSGGRLGWLYDLFNNRDDWFALYAIDSNIDDATWCEQVKRGKFRLHPKGPSGLSEGCIVIDKLQDFVHLRTMLRSGKPLEIPEKDILAWARLVVR
ncbi:uncharacterized protein DUF2778 [Limnobacter thiooxidans]|uniref:DUF2778 domain-containing protein n=2 Tax=Limnobacter thiooxidans TaxID=131080 RepID=A0AA86J2Y9_9BURK|nr:uncharacterized protein DUF2778 [Limnobacter thiooxidans]BET27608.1 DUF2778 domain-containing protein [Limnobacter thiooxidans]